MNANVDFVVPMTYTMWMGSGAGPYKSGYDTPVGLPTQWTGYSGYSLSSPAGGGPLTYLNDGYTPSKVAVSISFEGTQFSGVGGKMGMAYSSYAFCSTVSKSLGAYAAIPASGRAWDATAQAAYCISGSTVYSYQTPQSVTAIVSWAKTQGFGAIMIYDLGCGYEATAGAADPQALLHAIWQTANGPVTPPAPTGTLIASPTTLPIGGGTVTLTWTSANAVSASIDNGVGTVALNGSTTVTVDSSKIFTLFLTNANGTSTYAVFIGVGVPDPPDFVYPLDGQSNVPRNATARWTISDGAVRYQVQIATDSLFTTLSINDSTLTDTTRAMSLARSRRYYRRVRAFSDDAGWGVYSDKTNFTTGTTSGVDGTESTLPTSTQLLQNYPNPFNPSTTIGYQLSTAGTVTLKVYDVIGRELESLVNAEQPAGRYSVVWNAGGRASGVYFIILKAGTASDVRRMMLVK
jgi:hypothetical protein